MKALLKPLCCPNFDPMCTLPGPSLHRDSASWLGGLVPALMLVQCLGLWSLAETAQAVEPLLGTLLYSPAQRQAITAARKRPGSESATASLIAPKPSLTRLDGVVSRERAQGTAWINGEPLAQGAPKAPRILGLDAVVEGRRLRVGESVNSSTGTKTDIVAPGAVRKGIAR